jgi:hypothetical protein
MGMSEVPIFFDPDDPLAFLAQLSRVEPEKTVKFLLNQNGMTLSQLVAVCLTIRPDLYYSEEEYGFRKVETLGPELKELLRLAIELSNTSLHKKTNSILVGLEDVDKFDAVVTAVVNVFNSFYSLA